MRFTNLNRFYPNEPYLNEVELLKTNDEWLRPIIYGTYSVLGAIIFDLTEIRLDGAARNRFQEALKGLEQCFK